MYAYGSQSTFPANGSGASANYWVDPVFSTTAPASDNGAPVVVERTPAPGATGVAVDANVTARFDESVVAGSIVFALTGPAGAVPATTSYDGPSRTVTLDPTVLAAGTTYTASLSGATDAAGNTMAPLSWSFTTSGVACPCSLWSASTTPANASSDDPGPVELGVRFQASSDGWISGVLFYKGAGNDGVHVGSLWTSTGVQLAQAPAVDETSSGWQLVRFPNLVAVTAGETYVASYFAPQGHYARDDNYFTPDGRTSGPLHAFSSGEGGNGVFAYGPGSTYPVNASSASSNYWVDPLFVTDPVELGSSVPTALQPVPAPGAIGVPPGANVQAHFDEPVVPGSISFTLSGPGGAVSAAVSYDAPSRTVTLDPTAALAAGTTYTASLAGANDGSGHTMVPLTWSFTVVGYNCPCTLWNPADAPGTAAADDGDSLTLGVRFRPSIDGVVTGVRFYKGPGNGGTHVGSLWSATGDLLAEATFTGESASGWQQVTFASPVAVTADTTYVVGYFAPQGHYARDDNYFLFGGRSQGPLYAFATAEGGNGVFTYGTSSQFPATASGASSNYWVDPVFATS